MHGHALDIARLSANILVCAHVHVSSETARPLPSTLPAWPGTPPPFPTLLRDVITIVSIIVMSTATYSFVIANELMPPENVWLLVIHNT